MALLHIRQVRQLKKEGPHAPYTSAGTKEELPANINQQNSNLKKLMTSREVASHKKLNTEVAATRRERRE
jgi:hypothetical protein